MSAASYAPMRKDQTVRTGKVRLSYARLFEPDPISAPPKYGTVLLIPKTDTETIRLVQEAAYAAGVAKWGEEKLKAMLAENKANAAAGKGPVLRLPFRDGDAPAEAKRGDAYKGHFFLSARNKNRPAVVGRNMAPLTSEGIKSGDYVVAVIYFHPFSQPNIGISVLLNSVQLVEVGEALAAGGDPMAMLEMHGEEAVAPASASGSAAFGGML